MDELFGPPEERRASAPAVLTVSQLSAEIQDLLETAFPLVWVGGEISNFMRASSGHCYFTLKDDAAQLKAVQWRNTAARNRFELHDGLAVICRGNLSVYPPRGAYQLVVEQILPQGVGALELALRKLRDKLAAEGLFDPDRKRPIPAFPRRVAVVTSPTGAAIRDFLEVLRRRFRGVDVLIVPSRVQGEGAAAEIAAAIDLVNRLREPLDVLVVARGGGSLEDLWSFNEEAVVRAIARSRIPVISAIGHEIDVTLADLVADRRALTPSEAAEIVSPDALELQAQLQSLERRLVVGLRTRATAARNAVQRLAESQVFRRPFDRLHVLAQQVDELSARARRAAQQRVIRSRQGLEAASAQLESLSPLQVLSRGYSLAHLPDGALVRSVRQLQAGTALTLRLRDGTADGRITQVHPFPDQREP